MIYLAYLLAPFQEVPEINIKVTVLLVSLQIGFENYILEVRMVIYLGNIKIDHLAIITFTQHYGITLKFSSDFFKLWYYENI